MRYISRQLKSCKIADFPTLFVGASKQQLEELIWKAKYKKSGIFTILLLLLKWMKIGFQLLSD